MITTGRFLTPAQELKSIVTKVHVVDVDNQPICGSILSREAEYHMMYGQVYEPAVTCQRCKEAISNDY